MRGRPKSKNPKGFMLKVRLSKDDVEMLNALKELTGENTSVNIRKAIKHYYFNVQARLIF